jgi:hypothetical protein
MKFYNFHQSNPGGYTDEKMPAELYIQATSPEVANSIAETLGVYFDGQQSGVDCECCNDRWYRADEWSSVEESLLPKATEEGRIVVHYATELTKALG